MDDTRGLVKSYLQGDSPTMQIATVKAGKPWIATVYFVADDELNLYWLSWPERRHSQELMEYGAVAAAIVIKSEQPVIGLQIEGSAEEVTDESTVEKIMGLYVVKYHTGETFYDAFKAGKNHHHMYKLAVNSLSLFDEVHFAGVSPLLLKEDN